MCFDEQNVYTSIAKDICKWDKETGKLISRITVPPNDNLRKGALLCVDENRIFFNSIYFFHVLDKETHEVRVVSLIEGHEARANGGMRMWSRVRLRL